MKLAKSLLLGSAAALATVAGAQAADLPVRKAAPVAVEYVRVCSTYGAGFFVIPGTDSCVKIGGRVRADALIQERFSRSQDHFGFRARGRMSFDVRTPTPYGLLRTFVRFQIQASSGTPFLGGAYAPVGPTQSAILDQGFVQFGGLTAGRVTSFFSNPDLPTGHMGTLNFDDAADVTLFAYTFSFGNGLSATISAEDPWARRLSNGPFLTTAALGFDPALTTPAFGINYEGARMPDVVGNLKYSGTWGTAQISGALHEVSDLGSAALDFDRERELGFAVAGYLGVNLPMIAAGDAAWLAATYTQGALNYLTGGGTISGSTTGVTGFDGNTPFFNGVTTSSGVPLVDGFRNADGDLELTEAFSVAGGLRHYWIPNNLRSNLFGSWLHVEHGEGASFVRPAGTTFAGVGVAGTRDGFVDFDLFRIGGNLIWSPIGPGFDIGVEVMYKRYEFDGRIVTATGGVPATPPTAEPIRVRTRDNEDSFETRIRVQRDF
jgi:hypothetical protein